MYGHDHDVDGWGEVLMTLGRLGIAALHGQLQT